MSTGGVSGGNPGVHRDAGVGVGVDDGAVEGGVCSADGGRRSPEVEVLAALDRELARCARGSGALRLRIGDALVALRARSGHHELGFSSLAGYAVERCQQKGRWAAESCTVARRLAKLPRLRAALVSGKLSWSMVELVSRHATEQTEEELLASASSSTVRRMRAELCEPRAVRSDEDACELKLTMDWHDAWLFECTRWLFDRVEPHATADELVHMLLAEGLGTLCELVPPGELAAVHTRMDEMRARWVELRAQRQACCDEVEARCEGAIDLAPPEFEPVVDEEPQSADEDIASLDARIQRLCQELGAREVAFGALAERFWRADGWRRLGYASEQQYARERLGVSLSSVKSKRALARRSAQLPALASALEAGAIGFEAALLVTRIATEATVDAWIARARERTVKLLREEVEAAELRARLGAEREQHPPDAETLKAIASARQTTGRTLVASGEQSGEPLAARARAVLGQMSVSREGEPDARSKLARVTYRLWVSEDTRDFWRAFERCFEDARCWLPEGTTLVSLLCVSFYGVWAHVLEPKVAYGHIYARDGFVCQNPLCTRRDLTPHHLRFRSAGGGDEDENVVSLCTWCHLQGIHQGRIRAEPPASEIHWELGRPAVMVVKGRRKLPAADAAA